MLSKVEDTKVIEKLLLLQAYKSIHNIYISDL